MEAFRRERGGDLKRVGGVDVYALRVILTCDTGITMVETMQ
jgi:hypothetical protein